MHNLIVTGNPAPSTERRALRALLLTDKADGSSADRLIRYGSLLDTEDDLEAAVSRIADDPIGYDLFVMDCDAFGGLDGAEAAVSRLIAAEARMRILLISREFDEPALPMGLRSAVSLPASVSDATFRRGLDHVLRDRVAVTLM